MEAQFQVRQNALEAQDYMQDLLSWQQTLKDKSSRDDRPAADHGDVPAVRGRAPGTVSSAPEHMQLPLTPNKSAQAAVARAPRGAGPAAHTYKNYSKWDKFDVEAALEEPDSTPSMRKQKLNANATKPQHHRNPALQATSHSCNNPSAPMVAPAPVPTAAGLKDQGNKLYQTGYFSDAVSCYTQSLELHESSITYANRAMANIKLNKFQDAEQDCSAALQLDPEYIKALHRRGTARKQLGKLLEAAADFEEALRLEPANKTLLVDRDAAVEQYLQQQKIPSSCAWSSIPVHQQLAETIAVNRLQSTAAVTRATAGILPANGHVHRTQQGTAAAAADVPPTAVHTEQLHAVPALALEPAGVSETTSNGEIAAAATSSSDAAAAQGGAMSPASMASPYGAAATAATAAEAAAAQLAARLAAGLKAPRTSSDFEAAWRSFKGDEGLQGKYLKLLPPQHLPAVFKTSLTAPILTAILAVALKAAVAAEEGEDSTALDAAHAVALIQHMVGVPRFDMTVMCLTARDKAALKQLWSVAAESCKPHLQNSLESVRTKYRL